jgi:hypothetical protein
VQHPLDPTSPTYFLVGYEYEESQNSEILLKNWDGRTFILDFYQRVDKARFKEMVPRVLVVKADLKSTW